MPTGQVWLLISKKKENMKLLLATAQSLKDCLLLLSMQKLHRSSASYFGLLRCMCICTLSFLFCQILVNSLPPLLPLQCVLPCADPDRQNCQGIDVNAEAYVPIQQAPEKSA